MKRKPTSVSIYRHIAVIGQIRGRMAEFTPRQRALAEFILQNPESLAFLSITDLAKKTGVSQATVVRFSNMLGYDGYAQLSKETQQAIQYELGTVGRFHLAYSMKEELVKTRDTTAFERVLTSEINSLINLTKSIKTADFYRCVDMMAEADRVCIIGCMASSCLANFFGYILAKIFPRVDVIDGHTARTTAICSSLNPDSLVFLISFPRYPRATFELGRYVSARGAKIIVITNSSISPIVPLANLSFFIPVGIRSFADTYAAPMAFITALVTEMSERNPDLTQHALRKFDEYASKMDLFLKSRVRGRSPGRPKDSGLSLGEYEKRGQ